MESHSAVLWHQIKINIKIKTTLFSIISSAMLKGAFQDSDTGFYNQVPF